MANKLTNMDDFKTNVLDKKDKKVLVDMYADWCGPCKMQSPIIDKIAEERKDIDVYKINVDECPEIAEKYDVFSIPSLFIFKDGEVTKNFVGLTQEDEIIKELDK